MQYNTHDLEPYFNSPKLNVRNVCNLITKHLQQQLSTGNTFAVHAKQHNTPAHITIEWRGSAYRHRVDNKSIDNDYYSRVKRARAPKVCFYTPDRRRRRYDDTTRYVVHACGKCRLRHHHEYSIAGAMQHCIRPPSRVSRMHCTHRATHKLCVLKNSNRCDNGVGLPSERTATLMTNA